MAKIRLGLIGCGHMMGIHAKTVNDCTTRPPLTSSRTALESLRTIWKLYDAEKTNTVADLRSINPNSYL